MATTFPKDNGTTVRGILNLVGVFLIHLPSRPLLYFGNLAVYIPSYVILHTGQLETHSDKDVTLIINNDTQNLSSSSSSSPSFDNVSSNLSTHTSVADPETLSEHGIQESWFVPVFSSAWMVGVFLSGVVAHFIRVRFVIGIGIIFQSGSLFVSYYTINVSEPTFFVTLCIFIGFGAGLYEGLILKNYVVDRLSKRIGTVTSFVLSSGPLGGVIINQFITWYINPDNLSPDRKLGEMRVFSQDSIQERIPSMFLILGGAMIGLTTLGFFMLDERKKTKSKAVGRKDQADAIERSSDSDSYSDSCPLENGDAKNSDGNKRNRPSIKGNSCSIGVDLENAVQKHKEMDSNLKSGKLVEGERNLDESNGRCEIIGGLITDQGDNENVTFEKDPKNCHETLLHTEEFNETEIRLSGKDSNSNGQNVSLTPKQLIKSLDFYKIAIVYIFGSSARLFLSVYYKVYGQEWIHDDHFLTNLATIMSFLAIFTTVIWGLVLDKIGLKLCFVVIYTGISIFFILMYFCAKLNKWAYFFVTLSNSTFVNYIYPVFTIAVIKWFGRDYLSAKLGIVEIFSLAGYVLATFVLDALMKTYGYLSGFIWTASVHFIGLIIIVISYPRY